MPAVAKPSGSSDEAAEARPAGGDDKGDGRRRRYGGAGLPRGVKHLAKAFTWYLPSAVASDKAWRKLPLGPAGSIDVTLKVNAEGKVVDADYDKKAAKHLVAIIKKTMALVWAGRFALDGKMGKAGREKLRIEVTLSESAPHQDLGKDGKKPHHVFNYGRDLPSMGTPGRAYFTQLSGRHFEARITILSSQSDDN